MLCLDTDLGVLGSGSSGALFARLAYSGNSTAGRNIITGVDNDLVWIKNAAAESHFIYDSGRGVSKNLSSNLTSSEGPQSGITSFNDDGFTIGTSQNSSGQSYRCFAWKKNAQYLDIVTYTGNGSNRTIAHALNATPQMIIIKSRSLDPSDWAVYHANNTAAPETDYLLLNTSGATVDDNTYWNDTLPTSSVFSVGTNNNVNKNGDTYVAYIFSESSGNSKFGGYTGTGATQSIGVGFEPSLVMVRNTTGDVWGMYMGNALFTGNGKYVQADRTDAEATSTTILDITATGFTAKNSGKTNQLGLGYIYCAWKGV
jgi:hypothetical protein